MAEALSQQQLPAQDHSALLYIPAEDKHSHDLLLFEERMLHNPGWKRATAKGKQIWSRLKEKYEQFSCEVFAGDRFVGKMRHFQKVTILLNRPIDPALVKKRLQQMVKDRSYHHLRWLIIDLVMLPFTVFLALIPGPNLIGYYLLFRVFSHWKSYRSASRARLDDLDVRVSNRAKEISALFRGNRDIRTALQELRQRYGLRALQEHQFISQRAFLRDAWKRLRHRISDSPS